MSGQAKRPFERPVSLSSRQNCGLDGGQNGRGDWLWRRARDFVVKGLVRKGNGIWSRDPRQLPKAIGKIEQAWSLMHDPQVAVQLATMYDQANRNQDALVVLREAFRRDPRHALVRHHAAITLLRHGNAVDIRDFFESVLKIDPKDAFARFVMSLLDSYDVWVGELASAIEDRRGGLQPFVISCPVWGQPFADSFVRYLCATLLSANNLPALSTRCSVHVVLFTTAETEKYLRAHPLFARLKDYAAVHFVHYTEHQVNYGQAMEAYYGHEDVFYSDHSLAFYFARNCKFALMSCAHYVALAAGRATDAFVSCQVADTVLNDGALTLIADRLAGSSHAVLINCIQLDGNALRSALDEFCRRDDGVIEITPQSCTRIVIQHCPEYNFATADDLPQIPLRVCWRVGTGGILVHGNHYHPIGLRPGAFQHPLSLSIDPIDSRFVDRSSLTMDRIHLVQDSSIVGLSMEDGPLPEQLVQGKGSLSIADAGFWLWGYWGRLRGTFFRTPLRFGSAGSREDWTRTEAKASALVDAIVAEAAALEESQGARATWRL